MKKSLWMLAPCLPALAACASQAEWRAADGLAAELVEVQVDARGRSLEIEYHVAPDVVPASVHAAMNALHPGGRATGAEKEYVGSTLYWELTKEVGGREVEAMFLPDGTLHSEELEVPAASVPDALQAAVAKRIDGQVTKWEEIRDAQQALVEYHAKVAASGKKYKLRLSLGGEVLGVFREVPAEIEVPVD